MWGCLLVFVLAAFCWTKSLSCTVTDFTRMSYQFRVFKYSEFISLIWKGPYYDKISVTSIKKEFSDSKKTLQSLQLSKSRIPSLSSERPSETPGHSSVNNINNDVFNQGFSQFSDIFFRDMFLEDSVRISRQCSQIPCIRPNDVVFRPTAHQSSNICSDDVIYRSDAQLSKASSVRKTRTFHPDLPLCREASNCSSLHPSRRFSSTSGRHSVFDQLWDFLPKHRYGKIAATVRTMWILVRTRSSIRQVAHSKFRRPVVSLHGPDARATYMEIVCI